ACSERGVLRAGVLLEGAVEPRPDKLRGSNHSVPGTLRLQEFSIYQLRAIYNGGSGRTPGGAPGGPPASLRGAPPEPQAGPLPLHPLVQVPFVTVPGVAACAGLRAVTGLGLAGLCRVLLGRGLGAAFWHVNDHFTVVRGLARLVRGLTRRLLFGRRGGGRLLRLGLGRARRALAGRRRGAGFRCLGLGTGLRAG